MKKISISLLALAAALAAAPAAHADTSPGWYVGAGVGAAFAENPTIRSVLGRQHASDEDANVDLLGNVGYAWPEGFRLEGEYFHNQNNTKNVENVTGGGHVTNNAVFLNVLYDFTTGSVLTPYIGAGFGPDFVNVENVGVPGAYLKGDTVVGAYQGIVGVAAQLDRNWAVMADYRYIASLDPKVDFTGGSHARMSNASHNVVVGLRYSFGGDEAVAHKVVASAVEPYVADKPEVAPVVQNFMVFFDFDKSTLTPEAKRIVASAAKEYKKDGFAKITVTGHTDTVGTAAYNQKLSERRALAVEKELGKLGVGAKHVKKLGVGKGDLLVPTADGVREAQNRRAEIVLAK